MMSVTVVVEVRSKEGTKCTLDSSVNLSLGLVRASLGLDNVLREYSYLKGEDVVSICRVAIFRPLFRDENEIADRHRRSRRSYG